MLHYSPLSPVIFSFALPIIFRYNSQFDCSTTIRAEREARNFVESCSLIILDEVNSVSFKCVTVNNGKDKFSEILEFMSYCKDKFLKIYYSLWIVIYIKIEYID